jgi:hypothetical protein
LADAPLDFLCIPANAGDAIKAAAAQQLIRINDLLFIMYFLPFLSLSALPQSNQVIRDRGALTGQPWDWRDVPLFRG